MFSVEGICDWCKQPKLLTRHEYVDGKKHIILVKTAMSLPEWM